MPDVEKKSTENVAGQRPFDHGIRQGSQFTVCAVRLVPGPHEVLVGIVNMAGVETAIPMSVKAAREIAIEILRMAAKVETRNTAEGLQ